jgi:phage baseplate assembly protein gpV
LQEATLVKFLRNTAYTGGVSDPEASDIDRRAADVVKFGKVHEVDYKRTPPSYRILIGDEKDEDNHIITDWLPAGGGRAKGDRETHFLEVGEKVILFAEGGELATAAVHPAGTYTEEDDEKATTDKPGVWKKIFQKPKSKDDQGGGEGQGNQGEQSGKENEILGEISYDRETGDWLVKGLADKGSITLEGSGCSIVMKDGTITLKAKNVVVEASEKFESKAKESHHSGSDNVKLIGKTYTGLDNAGEAPGDKVALVGDVPTKNTFSKK